MDETDLHTRLPVVPPVVINYTYDQCFFGFIQDSNFEKDSVTANYHLCHQTYKKQRVLYSQQYLSSTPPLN